MFPRQKQEQSLDIQRNALIDAGCDPHRIYTDTISGTKWQRPGLEEALAYMRPDDTLVVARLDRLGRNLVDTVNTIADLADRDINVKVLEPALDTSRPADKVVLKTSWQALQNGSVTCLSSAPAKVWRMLGRRAESLARKRSSAKNRRKSQKNSSTAARPLVQ